MTPEETTFVLRPMTPEDVEVTNLTPLDGLSYYGPRKRIDEPQPAVMDNDGTLVVEVDGEYAGSVNWRYSMWGPTSASRALMIGIFLLPRFRGRGLGAKVQRELAKQLFAATTVNRVEAHTNIKNIAEQRALEKAGFTKEGIIRGAMWWDGRYWDGPLYSILRAELEP